jgi:hypothetical protein
VEASLKPPLCFVKPPFHSHEEDQPPARFGNMSPGNRSRPQEQIFAMRKPSTIHFQTRAAHVAPAGPFRVARYARKSLECVFRSLPRLLTDPELIRCLSPRRPPRDELREPAPSFGVPARFHFGDGRPELGLFSAFLQRMEASPDERDESDA